ncbi:hypothetical protein DGG96_07360 [Legionella qingyii]|uniref:Uncharacterized protein n=1 Tax=Legionella qingyii TaxID=2184757 RepID=A0A317U2P3_9GAMM|nr:hypothetical protein DGG96_07360 [Legionella qingyii]
MNHVRKTNILQEIIYANDEVNVFSNNPTAFISVVGSGFLYSSSGDDSCVTDSFYIIGNYVKPFIDVLYNGIFNDRKVGNDVREASVGPLKEDNERFNSFVVEGTPFLVLVFCCTVGAIHYQTN